MLIFLEAKWDTCVILSCRYEMVGDIGRLGGWFYSIDF